MRRPRGTGGLSYRASDGMWIGRVDFGWTPQGTRDRRTVSSRRKTEAARKLRELLRQRDAGDVSRNPRITVKGWAEDWLPRHVAKVRPKTQATDKGAVNKWIIPTIGHRRLMDLTPADVRALNTAVRGAGLSSTTAATYHRILMKMLKDAVRENYHVPASVLAAETPRNAVNDRMDIPVDQARAILAVIAARDDAPRWMLSFLTGMRQAEILGLLVDHVDFAGAGTILVEWQLQHPGLHPTFPDGLRVRHLTGTSWLTETKTSSGERLIRMGPLLRAAMLKAATDWQENPWGLVWVSDDGKPIRDYDDRATWKAIQAEAEVAHPSGRPWHLHECRHTFITMLKRANVDDAVIAQIVGQSRLVDKYVHLGPEDAAPAIGGVESTLLPQIEP
jgi:integrase